MKLRRFLFMVLGLGIIILGIMFMRFVIMDTNRVPEEETVKCYDRYSNEIIGEKCIEVEDLDEELAIGMVVSIMMIVGGGIIIRNQFWLIKYGDEDDYD